MVIRLLLIHSDKVAIYTATLRIAMLQHVSDSRAEAIIARPSEQLIYLYLSSG